MMLPSKRLLAAIGCTYVSGVISVVGYSYWKKQSVREENIIWESQSPSKGRGNKGDLCFRLEKNQKVMQEGCSTNWSRSKRDDAVEGEIWLRFKKESLNLGELNNLDISEDSKEGWWSFDNVPVIKEVMEKDKQERICRITNKDKKWVEFKCHGGGIKDLEGGGTVEEEEAE